MFERGKIEIDLRENILRWHEGDMRPTLPVSFAQHR